MSNISDYNEAELWTVQSPLKERYKRDNEVQLAETELRLNPIWRPAHACTGRPKTSVIS